MSNRTFPPGFVWGAATSAYQIEGAANADGKGPSNWDAFTHTPGRTHEHQTGDVAADHYHRSREDVALMRQIGLRAYRFSVAWSRVLPEGTGSVNEAGLGFYDRLVDELLAAGIDPWLTVFHWDVPLALHHRGSWRNRDIVGWFGEYTRVLVDRLSDRVSHWITINEPQIFLGPSQHEALQTETGTRSDAERLLCAHHALLAHGTCAQVIRSRAKKPPCIGWAPIGRVRIPFAPPLPGAGAGGDGRMFADPAPEDIDAARRATLGVLHKDFWNNTWFADPVVLGHYPDDGLRLYGHDAPRVAPGDMQTIRQPLDFYGINVYDAEFYRACTPYAHNPAGERATVEKVHMPPGHARTAVGWSLAPEALYWGPKFLHERYQLPIVVTENGMSSHDWVGLDGRVRDTARIDYTRRYLLQLRRAAVEGVPVGGYFHWSLLDNMEWASGYKERFGLVHVDFTTLTRTPKDSARWYARVISSAGASLDEPPVAD